MQEPGQERLEYDAQRLVRSVLDKQPVPESLASIDLGLPRSRPRL